MIMIFSINNDTTTDKVMDWIQYFGRECVRWNSENTYDETPYSINLSQEGFSFNATINGIGISSKDINAVWFRKGLFYDQSESIQIVKDEPANIKFKATIQKEILNANQSLYSCLNHADFLCHPQAAIVQKTNALNIAKKSNLEIPDGIITNSKTQLKRFFQKYPKVIIKPIGNINPIAYKSHYYPIYTEILSQKDLEIIPDSFSPSLVQEYIEKKYELRIFALDNKFYPMAIFSQMDSQTSIDFRQYNKEKPNRKVLYQLPDSLTRQLIVFMKSMNLNTGSIDMIRSTDGRYVFLEINPAGQFGMVSYPCNYNLYKKVAQYLVDKDSNETE